MLREKNNRKSPARMPDFNKALQEAYEKGYLKGYNEGYKDKEYNRRSAEMNKEDDMKWHGKKSLSWLWV